MHYNQQMKKKNSRGKSSYSRQARGKLLQHVVFFTQLWTCRSPYCWGKHHWHMSHVCPLYYNSCTFQICSTNANAITIIPAIWVHPASYECLQVTITSLKLKSNHDISCFRAKTRHASHSSSTKRRRFRSFCLLPYFHEGEIQSVAVFVLSHRADSWTLAAAASRFDWQLSGWFDWVTKAPADRLI